MRISVHLVVDPKTVPAEWLAQCLAALRSQQLEDIVIADHVEGNLTAARLAAFEKQNTDWVSWVDPDDIVPPGAYEAMAAAIEPGVGLVTGDELLIRANGSLCGTGAFYRKPVQAAEIRRCVVAAHKGVIHRDAIPLARQIVGDDPWGIDWALMLAATLVGEVRKVSRPIYQWRRHRGQMNRSVAPNYEAIGARFDALKGTLWTSSL